MSNEKERLQQLRDKKRLAELRAKKNIVESSKGSVFEEDVRKENLPQMSPVRQTALNVNDLITFGTAPYIEAAGDVAEGVITGKSKDYQTALLERQLEHQAARTPGFELAKVARDVVMPSKTAMQRIAIPTVTAGLEKAGDVDITSSDGVQDVITATAGSAGMAGLVEKGKDAANYLLSLGTKKQPFTQKELIERYLLSKKRKTPKDVDFVYKNRELLSKYADEGIENVEQRLGKNIAPFKEKISKLTEPVSMKTMPDVVQVMDRAESLADSPMKMQKISEFKNKFLSMKRSPAELQNLVEDIDNYQTSFYNKLKAETQGKMPPKDLEYHRELINLRNTIKDKYRSFGQKSADEAFSEFQQAKPYLEDIRSADIRFRTKEKPTDLITDVKAPYVKHPTPTGIVQMGADFGRRIMDSPYTYTDDLSAQIARNAPNPQDVLNLPSETFTQQTMVRPGLEQFGRGVGSVLRASGPALSRQVEPQKSSIERFRDIYDKIPYMGPYQDQLEKASEDGNLPMVHFYLMKTDPEYVRLFTGE